MHVCMRVTERPLVLSNERVRTFKISGIINISASNQHAGQGRRGRVGRPAQVARHRRHPRPAAAPYVR